MRVTVPQGYNEISIEKYHAIRRAMTGRGSDLEIIARIIAAATGLGYRKVTQLPVLEIKKLYSYLDWINTPIQAYKPKQNMLIGFRWVRLKSEKQITFDNYTAVKSQLEDNKYEDNVASIVAQFVNGADAAHLAKHMTIQQAHNIALFFYLKSTQRNLTTLTSLQEAITATHQQLWRLFRSDGGGYQYSTH